MISDYPIRNRVVDAGDKLTNEWDRWLAELKAAVDAAPYERAHVSSEAQDAAIAAAVAFRTPVRVTAVYDVSYTMRVTRAAGVSSSLTFALGWTAGAVAQAEARPAITGNTTATQQSGQFTIKADADTDVTYTVTYASAGAPTMTYELDVIVKQLP